MLKLDAIRRTKATNRFQGDFLTLDGERYYAIRDVDAMPPFFVNVVSSADHWLFVSSTGGLTAGRVSPETSLFPYVAVDKVHESALHTGSKTLFRVNTGGKQHIWEPFNREHDGRFEISRNLYKSISGNKLCFEEINSDLLLSYRYTWMTSDRFGFCRKCELRNLGVQQRTVELLDGLQNILPACTPSATQANASNLVDAYKWTELDESSGLATFTLYSGISDRAEPAESLLANTVFCLGIEGQETLISSLQINRFKAGLPLAAERHKRGIRGAYFVYASLEMGPDDRKGWQFIADLEQSQSEVIALRSKLGDPEHVAAELAESIAAGTDELARIMAETDALQHTAEENVTTHHYANVLFNNLRGGIFDDQDRISAEDFARSVLHFNRAAYRANQAFLEQLPATIDFNSLLAAVRRQDHPDLERLCYEYLPLRFGRRHGDPSRPWNKFTIRLRNPQGKRLFSFEGNWRDIFQNWEALTFSYPVFVDNVIAKFVNASTVDGYNPYRIGKDGIDWEVEDLNNAWSYIGYWGDHQIIYLLKLLELSRKFHPAQLSGLLRKPVFSYANVPYRIKPFGALLENPKQTVEFDVQLEERIARRVAAMGADGRLVLDTDGSVYRVNLMEKLLVPLLSKLGNFVLDGGIWLNTQRPEWNDANNALVGHGLSMVTLYYMRRYITFMQRLIAEDPAAIELSCEVGRWLDETAAALAHGRAALDDNPVLPVQRYALLNKLGNAASEYRQDVYRDVPFSGRLLQPMETIAALLDDALVLVDHSIQANRRTDGLYHAYNLLEVTPGAAQIHPLYAMLEGQVAALSAGLIDVRQAGDVLQALFDSAIYRSDQGSFMLYPDRALPGFLDKNRVPAADIEAIPLLRKMIADSDERIVVRDIEGTYRFRADFANVDSLGCCMDDLASEFGDEIDADRSAIQGLYEKVFNHRAFTGRSGGMFGFEGLGCIYWHMVSKLLLAVQENFYAAVDMGAEDQDCARLGQFYYRIREGLGFNKSPEEYGAFPTDPYSHTPKHAGAQQPGMTGQVKEEILTRFGELGVRVSDGIVHFQPRLLRLREFSSETSDFCFLNICGSWDHLTIPPRGLAFTWCQVPIIYRIDDDSEPSISIIMVDGTRRTIPALALSTDDSIELFGRKGRIQHITVSFRSDMLFPEQTRQHD